MTDRAQLEKAVRIHGQGYALIRWLETALVRGFVGPEAAHDRGSTASAARDWISEHRGSLPAGARPRPDEVVALANLFSTYLTSTFDLDKAPGEQIFSPDGHCFCPMCSWLVRRPHLRPKKTTAKDKRRAARMRLDHLRALAAARGEFVAEEKLEEVAGGRGLREPLGLSTYAADLLGRLKGQSSGPATLILWRSFAWKPEGSPKKGFKLTADGILQAREQVEERLFA